MADAFSIDISVNEFWNLTLKELYYCYDGYGKKLEREYNRMADMAMFNRAAYHKKKLRKSDLVKPMNKIPKVNKEKDNYTWADFDRDLKSGKRKFREVKPGEII